MNVTVHERTPVDFDLEIEVPAEELEPRLDAAMREHRKKMNLKGFRPGRVPLQMVRKLHGEALMGQIAEEIISEAWREEVAENERWHVIGSPHLLELEAGLGQDLKAVLRFGVRPEFELADTSAQEVRRLVRPVSEEDVAEEIERRLLREAEEAETEGPADEDSIVVADIQALDPESGTAIIGQRDEGREIDLTEERLRAEMRTAIVGKKAGDTVRVELPHEHGPDEGHDHEHHVDHFLLTIQQVRHRLKPDLDEEFVEEQTSGQYTTVQEYREYVRRELEEASRRLGDDFLREEIVRSLLEAHDFRVPETLVESVLDDMEKDLAKQVGGELPLEFDREGFRQSRREAAESQARWMLIQDKVVEGSDIKVAEEDFEREFERLAETGPGTADMVRQFVASQPQLLEGIRSRIMTGRLFEALADRFTVTEISPDELERQAERAG